MPDHFSTLAERYAAYRPRYPAAFLDLLAAEAPARELAWDVGCGSGQLSVGLAERFARVIATDLAQKQVAQAPAHPRIEYRCAPAEASGLPERCADLVVAAQAAHWFDFPRWLAEAARVGRPGALVAIATYGRPQFPGDDDVMHFHDVTLDPYWQPGREHVDTNYRDLNLPWPAVPAPALTLEQQWRREELIGYLSSWSAVGKLVEREGGAKFEAVCARLRETWSDADERRTVRWPLTVKLARLPL